MNAFSHKFMKVGFEIVGLVLFLLLSFGCKQSVKAPNEQEPLNPMVISDSLPWSERMALSVIKRHPEAWQTENDSVVKWNYKIGLLCTSFEELLKKTGNIKYSDYVEAYSQKVIDSSGQILNYRLKDYNIDMINSGKMLFYLYDKTNDERYLHALTTLRQQLKGHPRTKSGGFWHKKIYPNQMWLDGLYMGAPFYAAYNTRFENADKIDDIVKQFRLVYQNTYDQETGLLYHAWDESKQMEWADKLTGKSPGFWSRSMGWYIMAMVDVLDFIPEEHPGRDEIIGYLNKLSEALAKHQHNTGLWYQVTDLPNKEGNYLEASASCMFVYAFAKGHTKGYLPEKYYSLAQKAFNGIVGELVKIEEDGEIHLTQICGSAGLGGNPYRDGSFEYYVGETIKTDNLHGTGPFILAALSLDQ